ncbi:MAG TPA: 2-C-methyl-D-erythritol 4-phosphate cytidylyltransferase [Candidatus Agathobaculum intestinigallinarum]|nr:2-C-methyl-D-erythritol 4-phosphate cytidylyltransferase [Candidatus Agathobaculum intestinigallinarum]
MLGKRKKKPALPAVCAVIVAAGSSRRMGGENKLLLPLDDAPVLAHTLSAFEKCAAIRDIVLVCREQDILPYSDLARAFGISKLRTVTRGGDSRTASVLAGITAAPEDTGLVAVHDGARPLVSEAVITEAVYAAAEYGAAAPVVPVKDSIKRIQNGSIAADVPRDTLAAVQTPQVFDRALLTRALETAACENRTFTDDCAAVEAMGQAVRATHGSYENIKITTPEDILVAEAFLHKEED